MKPPIPVAICALLLAGCSLAPAGRPIAGFYSSRPVPEDAGHFQWADGKSRVVTRDLTLTLYPDGSFSTWTRMFFDGELVRFSGLAPYDLRTNSAGSWRFSDGRLFLRSVGPSYAVTRMIMQKMGTTITPEESEARAVYRGGHWLIEWKQTEYLFRESVPNPAPAGAALTLTGKGP